MLNKTIEYYNENADKFIQDTQMVSMSEVQELFLQKIPEHGAILDLGCGSGRDSKVFLDLGYKLISVDGSEKMCEATTALTGIPTICSSFQDYEPETEFDGIWACASLLHLKPEEIRPVVSNLAKALKPDGCFYMSFKYGEFQGFRNDRYFTDLTEENLKKLLEDVDGLTLESFMITSDVRPGRENEKWLNVFYLRE
ncbi:MAG: class I SAM-dependent methyltransferase [Clostridiales bacterium]|nr:class I SAM-dependent methyltransferase [Clostridiales bacterium]